jgi:two-component system response regulator DegU
MITLLIADSHSQYRKALRQVCEINGGFRVVAQAEDGEQLFALAQQFQPNVILLDVELPGLLVLETVWRIRSQHPQRQVVVLTLFGAERLADVARQAGAWTALAKDCEETTLFAAIKDAYQNVAHSAQKTTPCNSTSSTNA